MILFVRNSALPYIVTLDASKWTEEPLSLMSLGHNGWWNLPTPSSCCATSWAEEAQRNWLLQILSANCCQLMNLSVSCVEPQQSKTIAVAPYSDYSNSYDGNLLFRRGKKWALHYPLRNLNSYSAHPTLVSPTHFYGHKDHVTDTGELDLSCGLKIVWQNCSFATAQSRLFSTTRGNGQTIGKAQKEQRGI